MATVIVYYGWARNAQGKIEQVRVERGTVKGFEPNPHRKQEWTGRVFKSAREAAVETSRLNKCDHAGR